MENNKQKQQYDKISEEALFKAEISKSEQLRAIILISLLGVEALFLLIIYFFYSDEYLRLFKTNIAIYAIFIFTTLIIVYEFLIHYFLGGKKSFFLLNPRRFTYFNSFSEITLLTILLVFIVDYSNQTTILQTPATLTYFIFIVLSTFWLNFKLSVFTGALSAAEYILISIYYSSYFSETAGAMHQHHPLTGMQYLGQGLIMIITGIAAGFVADLIRKKLIISWDNIRKKNEVIDLFGQQISPQIVDNILKKQDELLGARKKVCIMFLDIRQFTPFVEQHQPEEVVTFLNKLFGFMIDIVQAHNGVINQFLGDGFMATFGAPVSLANSSQQATEAACEIIDKMDVLNLQGDIPKTRIGIGLHYDEAVTGNIGSSARKQYSITGKVVIMASRIEQLNKKYNTTMLISKEVYHHLDERTQSKFVWLEATKIKGSKELVSLYKYLEKSKG